MREMRERGGSFVQALAEAAARADPANLGKLKAAFPDLWERYRAIVAMTARDTR
jgi:hypothetical protein